MQLTSDRLRLEPFSDHDLTYLHGLWTDPTVRRYLWDDEIISRALVAEIIADSGRRFAATGCGYWTLFRRRHGDPVGFAGLRPYGEDDDIELLYGLAPRFWGQGLATEASLRILRHAFEDLGLDAVHAGADPPNRDSFDVIIRLGMSLIGRKEISGQEAVYYGITRQAFGGG